MQISASVRRRNCIVLAGDNAAFSLAQNCIDSIGDTTALEADLCFISLGLAAENIGWLTARGVTVWQDVIRIPVPPGGHSYARAQTCRPLLRDIFPGYTCYLWLDADIVCLDKAGLSFYLQMARQNPATGVVAMELDTTYVFVRHWQAARAYHKNRFERIERIYGSHVAEQIAYLYQFNSGVFAFHERSNLWGVYGENLQRASHSGFFDHMSDQDALNIGIVQTNAAIVAADATLNWLCSASLPVLDRTNGVWTRPDWPTWPIRLAHLAGRAGKIRIGDRSMSCGELYRSIGLWKDF